MRLQNLKKLNTFDSDSRLRLRLRIPASQATKQTTQTHLRKLLESWLRKLHPAHKQHPTADFNINNYTNIDAAIKDLNITIILNGKQYMPTGAPPVISGNTATYI